MEQIGGLDAYGNVTNISGSVKLTVLAVDEGDLTKNPPKINGLSQHKIVDGIAVFEKISLVEGVHVFLANLRFINFKCSWGKQERTTCASRLPEILRWNLN